MYLSHVHAENFRIFGAASDGASLDLPLRPGLNVIVGENDGGKSALIDAIRIVLGTTAHDYHRLTLDDFHATASSRATNFVIACTFAGLTVDEEATFLEHLTHEPGGKTKLVLRLDARTSTGGRVTRTLRTGSAMGGVLDDELREELACTYLRPLRDAEAALSGGRGSRLAQLLDAHPAFDGERADDFSLAVGAAPPKTLVGIMRSAEHAIKGNTAVTTTTASLNKDYLAHLSLGPGALVAGMGIARQADLRQILEKFDLAFLPVGAGDLATRRGLGLNNALFMAAELLLLGDNAERAFPLLLVEEPEAHLHPQLQLQVAEFIQERCSRSTGPPVQAILTTHSATLASKVALEGITMLVRGRAFPLDAGRTKLDASDYRFLSRFLDDTKANLFFARAVLIVEGEGEQLLIPTIAELLGCPFTKYGVSIVNVGSRGLFRYSRIFQRADGATLPVPVACLADRDVVPRAAEDYVKPPPKRPPRYFYDDQFPAAELAAITTKLKANDGGAVETFVSPAWTLEYDLARHGLARQLHAAVTIARWSKLGHTIDDDAIAVLRLQAKTEFDTRIALLPTADAIAAEVYEALKEKAASKAETAQFLARELVDAKLVGAALEAALPEYLVKAIRHVVQR